MNLFTVDLYNHFGIEKPEGREGILTAYVTLLGQKTACVLPFWSSPAVATAWFPPGNPSPLLCGLWQAAMLLLF